MEKWTVLKALQTLTQALKEGGIESPRLEAEVLLCHALGLSKAELYTYPQRELKPEELLVLREMTKRRIEREPLAYILGEKEFWSLRLKVTPDCLIPRPETELLVEEGLKLLPVLPKPWKFLDIGTGCGAIAIALAKEVPEAEVWATERSPYAIRVAEENVRLHGLQGRVRLCLEDLFPQERGFSLIASNPPYVPTQQIFDLPPEVKDYEPLEALDGGADGLQVIRRIIDRAPYYLKEGGWLMLEVGYGQADAVKELFIGRGFSGVEVLKDYSGLKRVVKGKWP